jgi:hypothetical protein
MAALADSATPSSGGLNFEALAFDPAARSARPANMVAVDKPGPLSPLSSTRARAATPLRAAPSILCWHNTAMGNGFQCFVIFVASHSSSMVG